MRAWPRDAATFVWLALIAATGLSWILSTHQLAGPATDTGRTVGIILIAFFKVRLVILYFMEVSTAPPPLRIACEAWVGCVCCAVVLLYLLG